MQCDDVGIVAVVAYDKANLNPCCADWRAVADLLRVALAAARKKAAADTAEDPFAGSLPITLH